MERWFKEDSTTSLKKCLTSFFMEGGENEMKFGERLFPILCLIFCGVYYYQTLSISSAGYPQVLLIILFILSIIWLLIDIFVKKVKEDVKENIVLSRVIIFALSSLFYYFLIEIIGFYIITPIFMIFLMYVLGVKNIKLLLGVSIFFTFFLYLAFSIFLSLPAPKGIFF